MHSNSHGCPAAAPQACLANGTGCSSVQRCDTTTNTPVCKPICDGTNPPCNANCLCATGSTCNSSGACVGPCSDGIKNGVETDIDCGGSNTCPRCANGLRCSVNSDCQSGVCTLVSGVRRCVVSREGQVVSILMHQATSHSSF